MVTHSSRISRTRRSKRPNDAAAVVAIEPLESRWLLAETATISITPVQDVGREGTPHRSAEYQISNSGDAWAEIVWKVTGGSATVGEDLVMDPSTGEGESHSVWIAPGGSLNISVAQYNDYLPEPTETFSVALSAPEQDTEVIFESRTANGSIEDDDVEFHAIPMKVTVGDEVEWAVKAVDYNGSPVAGVVVYVENTDGLGAGPVILHDVTNSEGYANLGLRGLTGGRGFVTVRGYDEWRVEYRSEAKSFWNEGAAPKMVWTQTRLNKEGQLHASFEGSVKVGLELWKYDGSARLLVPGLAVEWGMDHIGDYSERQADIESYLGLTDQTGRVYAYIDGNVVQRLFRDMDPTPTGASKLWAKFVPTHTFKKLAVWSKAPVIDLRLSSNTLRVGSPATLSAQVNTPQGLPVVGCRIVVTALEADDSYLGFLFNGGGGGPGINTAYSRYSDETGYAAFDVRIATFVTAGATGGLPRTAQLVAQCAADIYYSWRNADVETIHIP